MLIVPYLVPIQAREEFLFVQPRVNPALGKESLVQLADDRFVLPGV